MKGKRSMSQEVSTNLLHDMRPLLWIVTVGGLLLLCFSIYIQSKSAMLSSAAIPCVAWVSFCVVQCHEKAENLSYGKRILRDVRPLLWIVTVGGLLLAFYCVHKGFTGALPWIGTMVGLPWTAWGTVASFYMKKSEKQCMEGGITFESAKAKNFENQGGDTPTI